MLEALAAHREGLALKELAAKAGTSSAAAYHMAQTLVESGYAQRSEQRYTLGPKWGEVAATQGQHRFQQEARQLMLELAAELPGATIHYSELVGESIMVTQHIAATTPTLIQTGMHHLLPPYASGGGLVHLAFWPQEVADTYQARFAFEVYGLPFWRTREAYEAALAQMRREHHCLMPEKHPYRLKLSLPLLLPGGGLLAALTLQWNHPPETTRLPALRDQLVQTATRALTTFTQRLTSHHD